MLAVLRVYGIAWLMKLLPDELERCCTESTKSSRIVWEA